MGAGDHGPRVVAPEATGARAEYERRRALWQREADRQQRADRLMSTARMAVFLVGVALAWWVLGSAPSAWPALAAAGVLFAALVVLHGRVRLRLDRARRAVALYERNLERLDDRWIGKGPTGIEFLREEHVYARDLDLFGEGSLFQLLSGARTRVGERTLAAWLCASPEAPEIRARQQAVRELAPDVDVRERLALLGKEVHDDLDSEVLAGWIAHEPVTLRAWERPIAVVLAVLAVAALVAWRFFSLGYGLLGIVVVLEVLFGQIVKRRLALMTRDVEVAAKQLALLSGVLTLIERRELRSERLAGLASALESGGLPPSRQLARFEGRVQALLNSQLNAVYGLVAFLLQLRVHQAHDLESWRCRVGPSIPKWLAVAGEFEALCSLAAYAYEHPGHVFPEIVDGDARLAAVRLGHPLIPAAQCVPNDVTIDKELQLILLTGSNMSGKSTMLRTVGVNAVLAMAGAPACAGRLSMTPFSIGASIQVQDSLREGTSRFYAEIRRLRAIHRLTDRPRPVLFLLDEILQGTNSDDRRVGSGAVVASLVARGAVGLVTTHDLALTAIATELGPRARNAHFADELVEGRLSFDYRMREGVVRKGNALELMRSMGLDV